MIQLIEIPLAAGVPAQTQITTLAGRRYDLAFDWNGRIERWFFSLSTESGEPLLTGKGLTTRTDVLRQIRHLPACPAGTLALVDTTGADAEAGLYTLGREHALLFAWDDGEEG